MIYRILWILNFIILGLLFKQKVGGRGNIPENIGAVIAIDHSDFSDPLFICRATRRRLYYFVNYHDYYPEKGSPYYHKFSSFFGFVLRNTDQIPVKQGIGESQSAVDMAVNIVKKGELFAIFPEGTTMGSENLTRAHRGVARIALKARAPIIPIGLINTGGLLPRGKSFFQKYPEIKINIGKPLYYGKDNGKYNDKRITKLVADDVMRHIKNLCEEAKTL